MLENFLNYIIQTFVKIQRETLVMLSNIANNEPYLFKLKWN